MHTVCLYVIFLITSFDNCFFLHSLTCFLREQIDQWCSKWVYSQWKFFLNTIFHSKTHHRISNPQIISNWHVPSASSSIRGFLPCSDAERSEHWETQDRWNNWVWGLSVQLRVDTGTGLSTCLSSVLRWSVHHTGTGMDCEGGRMTAVALVSSPPFYPPSLHPSSSSCSTWCIRFHVPTSWIVSRWQRLLLQHWFTHRTCFLVKFCCCKTLWKQLTSSVEKFLDSFPFFVFHFHQCAWLQRRQM